VTFLPDGNKILTNSRDNTLKIIDMRTFEVVKTLEDPFGYSNFSNTNRATVC
jgi:autophagy-related protein 16-1